MLGSHLLTVEQPVHLALNAYSESAAHVSLDVQSGRDVELVEVLVAVACAHVARNGDSTVVADVGVAANR